MEQKITEDFKVLARYGASGDGNELYNAVIMGKFCTNTRAIFYLGGFCLDMGKETWLAVDRAAGSFIHNVFRVEGISDQEEVRKGLGWV